MLAATDFLDHQAREGFHSTSMLELHQRAAWIVNEPNVEWHHLLRSRFVGQLPAREGGTGIAVVVQSIVQQSEAQAELRGCMEYFSGRSLPVVFDFVGSLQIETRELVIREPRPNLPERTYSGQLSENGRVMTLHAHLPEGRTSKPIHLIHDDTLAEL